jgi:hypothetical protein
VDNKLGLIQSTLQVLETIESISLINEKTGNGTTNEQKGHLTCEWVIKFVTVVQAAQDTLR